MKISQPSFIYTLKYQSPFKPVLFVKRKQVVCKKIIVFFAVINELLKRQNKASGYFNLSKTHFIFSKIKKKNIIINRAPYRYKLAKNNLVFMLYCFTIKFKVFLNKPVVVSCKSLTALTKTLRQLHFFFKNCDTSTAPLKSVSVAWPLNFIKVY